MAGDSSLRAGVYLCRPPGKLAGCRFSRFPNILTEELIMRPGLLVATVLAVFVTGVGTAAPPVKGKVELFSERLVSGVPFPESDKPVYGIRLKAEVDSKGDITGVLELNPNAPEFDEFGFYKGAGSLPSMRLECSLKLVKKKKMQFRPIPGG